MNWQTIVQAWNRFWFEPQSPVPIALFRIGLGFVLLQNALQLLPDWKCLYSNQSLIPIQDGAGLWWRTIPHVDIFMISPNSAHFQLSLLLAYAVACLCVTVGLFTRFSCIFAWLLSLSIYCHCPPVASQVDFLSRFALMALCFSAAGDALSFDNIIRSFDTDWRVAGFQAPLTAQWPLRVLQLQICTAYLVSAVWQLNDPSWLDGNALHLLSQSEDASWFQVPIFDLVVMSRIFTWMWMLFAISFPFLVWIKEARYWVLLAGIALQLIVGIAIGNPLYHWFFIVSSVLFIDRQDLRTIWESIKLFVSDGRRSYAFFDASKPEDLCAVGVLHRLDVFHRFDFVESTIQLPGVVHSKRRGKFTLLVDGEERRDGAALSYMLQKIPLLWLFLPFLKL